MSTPPGMNLAAADCLGKLAESAGPSRTTFLTGAGISAEPPAALPLGPELTHRTAHYAFCPGLVGQVASLYDQLSITDQRGEVRKLPRLEGLLDIAYQTLGDAGLEVLDGYRNVTPNRFHKLYAWHLQNGGHHVTANFDVGIELAATEPVQVVHFHGALGPDDDLAELGARLAIIEPGFALPLRNRLKEMLKSTRLLVVAGYGGGDYFDMDPFLEDLDTSLEDLAVVWLHHANEPEPPRDISFDDQTRRCRDAPALLALRNAGAATTIISGPTAAAHQQLARTWGYTKWPDTATIPKHWQPTPWPTSQQPDMRFQRAATFEFWHRAGVPFHMEHYQDAHQQDPYDRPDARSHQLWWQGRYNEMRRKWRSWKPITKQDSVKRSSRIGASWWVQGRYLPALAQLAMILRRHRDDSQVDLQETRELLVRTQEHMAKTELAWVAKLLASWVAAQAPDSTQVSSTHGRLAAEDASEIASGMPSDQRAEAVMKRATGFVEVDSIIGALNYRYRRVRELSASEPDRAREQLQELHAAFTTIGVTGDAARTVTLQPLAHTVFGWPDLLAAAAKVQYGWMMRARIVGRWALRRLR